MTKQQKIEDDKVAKRLRAVELKDLKGATKKHRGITDDPQASELGWAVVLVYFRGWVRCGYIWGMPRDLGLFFWGRGEAA